MNLIGHFKAFGFYAKELGELRDHCGESRFRFSRELHAFLRCDETSNGKTFNEGKFFRDPSALLFYEPINPPAPHKVRRIHDDGARILDA